MVKLIQEPQLGPDPEPVQFSTPFDYEGGVIFQKPTTEVVVAGSTFPPTSIKVETNRYTSASSAKVRIVAEPEEVFKGQEIQVSINDTRIFTGEIREIPKTGEGSVDIVAFDAIKRFYQQKTSATYDSVFIERILNDLSNQTGAEIIFEPDMCYVRVSPDFNETKLINVLNQVTKWTNLLWWVDEFNVIHVSSPDPEIYSFGPSFIKKDSDAGEKEKPYQKVIVIGESPASESKKERAQGGFNAAHMISKGRVVGTAGEGSPVFRYRSKQIKTQTQAKTAAEAILDEFYRQAARGRVSIVGEGVPLRPFDVFEVPEVMGGERYIVASLTHRFTNEDGLITDVQVGGMVEETEKQVDQELGEING